MKDFKTFVNENLLVPRNLEGRKEKFKQMNIKLLSQEVIDGDLDLDDSFINIDPKFIKVKKVNGNVWLKGEKWNEFPEWLKKVKIEGYINSDNRKLLSLDYPKDKSENYLRNHNRLKLAEKG
jgi:hypothetical protein